MKRDYVLIGCGIVIGVLLFYHYLVIQQVNRVDRNMNMLLQQLQQNQRRTVQPQAPDPQP